MVGTTTISSSPQPGTQAVEQRRNFSAGDQYRVELRCHSRPAHLLIGSLPLPLDALLHTWWLCNQLPAVLRRDSQLWAIPVIVGRALVVTALESGAPATLTRLLGTAFTTGIPLAAIWRKWTGPIPAAARS